MLFVERGSEVNPSGRTLHCAAMLGHLPILKAILSRQRSLNSCRGFGGGTLLHTAASSKSRNKLQCFKTLIEMGSDVNARDRDGDTPLHRLSSHLSNPCSGADERSLLVPVWISQPSGERKVGPLQLH
jgi:ankyrin repeat protein